MDLSALQALLDRAAGVPVAVVGDVMLDRYVYGEVSRVSPEAPIPVLLRRSEVEMLGAAANVARNVAALGGAARLHAHTGPDPAGGVVAALLAREPAIRSHVIRFASGIATTVKTRFVAGGQQLLRLDDETGESPDFGAPPLADMGLEDAKAILISDYAKGVVTGSVIREVNEWAHAQGVPVIVDPKGRDFARYGAVDLIKPNAGELAAATGLPAGSDAEVEAALAAGLAAWPARAILVTRGAAGMSLAERGAPVRHVRGARREVFDVSGAGDTGLAALGLALAAGVLLIEAVEFAVLASGVAVGKRGTAVVTPAELVEAELGQRLHQPSAKIVGAREAAAAAQRWRAQGLKVGFTNGCFDVIHAGHVAYLAQARAWCDRLVVAVNSDASVRALKGEGRPVNELEARSVVLGGLASVDLVTSFDAPTPLALIEAVRPDVLVKGADYTREGVVGHELVESWGGEVRLAPLVEGRSTTATLAKLKAAG